MRCKTAKSIAWIMTVAAFLTVFAAGSSAGDTPASGVRDQQALFAYLQEEVAGLCRDHFHAMQIYYLDVTQNGWAEAVLIGPMEEHGYPEMLIIAAAEGGFRRIPADIPLGNGENIPEIMVGGSLAVTSTNSENGISTTVVNQYVYVDGMHLVFSGSQEEHAEHLRGLLWEMEHSCTGGNIDGRYNVQGFTKEMIAGVPTAFDMHVGVVVPMYDGVNKGKLDARHIAVGPGDQDTVWFAVFGELRDTVVTYKDSSADDGVSLDLGELNNSLVTVASYFPEATGHIAVSGAIAAGEGHEHRVEFVLEPTQQPGNSKPMLFRY